MNYKKICILILIFTIQFFVINCGPTYKPISKKQITNQEDNKKESEESFFNSINNVVKNNASGKTQWSEIKSSGYGPRAVSSGSKFHKGIDISYYNCYQDNVYPAVSGIITKKKTDLSSSYGRYIEIKDSSGRYWVYAHLESIPDSIKKYDTVDLNTVIGKIGGSGRNNPKAYSPHLHFRRSAGTV